MVRVINNEVEDYLKENVGKFLSLRTIYRDLKMKRRKALWLIHRSTNITNVHPLDIGSNKNFLHVYTYGDYVSKVSDYKKKRVSNEGKDEGKDEFVKVEYPNENIKLVIS